MKEEIIEIYLSNLEWTKTHDNMGGVMGNVVFKNSMSYEEYDKLYKNCYFILCDKDYITNLQESESYYYGQYKDYKQRNDKAIDKIQYIIDYGFDYDGFNTVESLKGLIDMLVDYARQSKDILKGDKDE